MNTEQWGEAVDQDDKLKLLINPESEYVQLAKMAFGRVMDDYIIDSAFNMAFSGQDGATSVVFPAAQVVPDTAIANDSSLDSGSNDSGQMSPQRCRAVKKVFDLADVDPDEDRFMAVSPTGLSSMLSHVQVTSADYNTMKALAEGAIDSYMGFKWIMTNRLPTMASAAFGPFKRTYSTTIVPANGGAGTGTDRLCLAWAKSGLGFALQQEVKVEIAVDPSLSFSTRLFAEMVMGATRIEEARVVAVPAALS